MTKLRFTATAVLGVHNRPGDGLYATDGGEYEVAEALAETLLADFPKNWAKAGDEDADGEPEEVETEAGDEIPEKKDRMVRRAPRRRKVE